MAENPLPTELTQTSVAPYILGVGGMLAIAAIFVLGVLYLRPQVDPLALMGQVGLLLGAAIPGILAFIKSGESKAIAVATYHVNNHAIEEFKKSTVVAARKEGEVIGAAAEKASRSVADVVVTKQALAHAEGLAEGRASATAAAPTAMAVNGPTTMDHAVDEALKHSAEEQSRAAAVQLVAAAEQIRAAGAQKKPDGAPAEVQPPKEKP